MRIYYKIIISRLGVVTFFTKRCNNKKLQSDKHKFSHSVESFDKICHKSALLQQCAKKVVSNSPGLLDFAIRLVNSVLNLPDRPVKFWGEFK